MKKILFLFLGSWACNAMAQTTTIITATNINTPAGIAVDASGNIYTGDEYSDTVRKLNSAGTVLAKYKTGLGNIYGLGVDASGNIYAAGYNNNTIKKITPAGVVSSFATGLNGPFGLIVTANGTIYVANANAGQIVSITSAGVKSTYATGLGFPTGVAIDGAGNMYASDQTNNIIWKITNNGATVTQFNSGISCMQGFVAAPGNTLYVGDYCNSFVYAIDASGTATVFASGNDISNPNGIILDPSGNLLVTNEGNNAIVRVTTQPLAVHLVRFTASQKNGAAVLNWVAVEDGHPYNYIIERAADAKNFLAAGEVNAIGNTAIENNYTFTDRAVNISSGQLFYRLKIVDKTDGKITYSNIAKLSVNNTAEINLYPNPGQGNTLTIDAGTTATTGYKLLNIAGQQVLQGMLNERAATVDVSTLAPGTYFIYFSNGQHQKWVKQ